MRLDTPDSGSYTVEIQIVIVNQWIDEIKWIYIYLHFFIGMRAAIISVHLYYYIYIYIYIFNILFYVNCIIINNIIYHNMYI